MTRFFTILSRNRRGTSTIELALAAPIMATLVIGIIDLSGGFTAKVQITQAAQRAIEKAMQADKQTTLYDTLRAEAASAANVPLAAVTAKYWLECNGVSQFQSAATMTADYNTVCPSGQTYARYVTVDITKKYFPTFNTHYGTTNSDGSYTIHGSAGIRVQ